MNRFFSLLITLFLLTFLDWYLDSSSSYVQLVKSISFDIVIALTSLIFIFFKSKPLKNSLIFSYSIVIVLAYSFLIFYYHSTGAFFDKSIFTYDKAQLLVIIKSSNISIYELLTLVYPLLLLIVLQYFFKKWLKIKFQSGYKFLPFLGFINILVLVLLLNVEEKNNNHKIAKVYSEFTKNTSSINKLTSKDISLFKKYFNPHMVDQSFPYVTNEVLNNTLEPFFSDSLNKPNIVLIIHESLNSTYSGSDAKELSFSPFLDSLAKESIYFPNILSSAERTFGAMPALFGIPNRGRNGFSMLKHHIPLHYSLPNILYKNGYRNYFYSTQSSDYLASDLAFLNASFFEKTITIEDYNTSQKARSSHNDEDLPWGLPDKYLFDYVIDDTLKKAPYFDVLLTVSSHHPNIVPNQNIYINKVREIIKKNGGSDDLLSKENVFSALLYTDDQIRKYFDKAKHQPEFKNTIFIITGDHYSWGAGNAYQNPLKRYHVPMYIYSPLLSKKGVKINALNSHFNLTPSLLALLNLDYPENHNFIYNSFDTSATIKFNKNYVFQYNDKSISDVLVDSSLLRNNTGFLVNQINKSTPSKTNDSILVSILNSFLSINKNQYAQKNIVPYDEFIDYFGFKEVYVNSVNNIKLNHSDLNFSLDSFNLSSKKILISIQISIKDYQSNYDFFPNLILKNIETKESQILETGSYHLPNPKGNLVNYLLITDVNGNVNVLLNNIYEKEVSINNIKITVYEI